LTNKIELHGLFADFPVPPVAVGLSVGSMQIKRGQEVVMPALSHERAFVSLIKYPSIFSWLLRN
jgi:hypothetical protein